MAPMIDPASSIPELIAFIRYSFRDCEFNEVRNILMEREKNVKADLENAVRDREEMKKQVDFMEKTKGYIELEKCDLTEKLGRSERRVQELEKMNVQMKENFEKLKNEKEGVEGKLVKSSKKCEELDGMIAHWKVKFEKLGSQKEDVDAKLLRSSEKCEQLDEMNSHWKVKFEKLGNEKKDVEAKLLRSIAKCEELDQVIASWKVKFEKLGSEKECVKEKLVLSSEECQEKKVRLFEMGKEIEELRRESLSANKTIEELKAREIEADRVVQELHRKNVEAEQTIDELRAMKMKSDKAAEYYENDLDPRLLKLERTLAKLLSVNVEDLADLANGDFAAAATDAEEEENVEVNSGAEDGVIVSIEVPVSIKAPAVSGSHTSATAMQSGDEVPTEKTVPSSSAAENAVILISDSDSDDETSIPEASYGQTNKRNRTASGEDSPMYSTKRRNISTSATPSRCTSLPNRVEERPAALQKSRSVECVDSTDSDNDSISDTYMNNLVGKGPSKKG